MQANIDKDVVIIDLEAYEIIRMETIDLQKDKLKLENEIEELKKEMDLIIKEKENLCRLVINNGDFEMSGNVITFEYVYKQKEYEEKGVATRELLDTLNNNVSLFGNKPSEENVEV